MSIVGKATLVIDLGNSETRVMTIFGKTPSGSTRYALHTLDNHFGPLEEGYRVAEEYTENTTRIFKMDNTYLCSGEMCRKEFVNSDDFRPTAIEKKYLSDVTKMSLSSAFLQGYMDVATFLENDINNFDVEWDVTLLLPPADIEVGAGKLKDMVKSIGCIDFYMPEVHKNLVIRSVNVLPEGFCAYIGMLYDMNRRVRTGFDYLKKETVIIFDIGAGTTDITVVENGKPIIATRYTMSIGGNNVHQKVRSELNKRGLELPEDVVRLGVERGYVKDGSKKVPIFKEIAEAKSAVSRTIVANVRNFFESTQYPIRNIEDMIVCGGGAVDSNIEGVKPIGEYLVAYMKRLSENISLVQLPMISEDGKPTAISPRHLNILGAGVASLR